MIEPFAIGAFDKKNDQLNNLRLSYSLCVIADLGLCQTQKDVSNNKKKVYGVIPYVAPEVFKGRAFTPASDIYSFGVIMWEVATGQIPFADIEHNYDLIQAICNGKRLEIPDYIPFEFKELLERCWCEDISKRPNAKELQKIFEEWLEVDKKTGKFGRVRLQSTHTTLHPGNVYHSFQLPDNGN